MTHFFDFAIDCLCIAGFDGFFKVLNNAWTELLGWSKKELKSKSFIEFIHPDDRDATNNARVILSHGKKILKFTNRYQKKDGSYVHLQWKSYPMEERQLIYAIARNVTEDFRKDKIIRESEEMFRSIIEGSPMGVLLYKLEDNNDLILVGGNSATNEILKINYQNHLGRRIEDIFPRLQEQGIPEIYRKLAKEGGYWRNERINYRDEQINSAFEVHAFQTGPNRTAVFFLEITERLIAEKERIALERQIQHSQKLESLGVLAGGIAHDFNNLIMGILGNLDLALMECTTNEVGKEFIDDAKKATIRAADLTRQLLAYSGKGKFVIKKLSLSFLIKDISNLLRTMISKNITLNFDLDDEIPYIMADKTQIQQVVMNLIINGAEAIGETQGSLRIATGYHFCSQEYLKLSHLQEKPKPGNFSFVEVSDTGCGIGKDMIKKIFDPFFTTKFTGRGLGLAAVLGIMRGHSGAIMVYSEEGRGSTFKVLFPVIENQENDEEDSSEIQKDDITLSGKVLIVDDEDYVRKIASQMLQRMGFTTITAENGIKALEILTNERFTIDLIILDLTMPYMDGKRTFSEIRKLQPDLKIILSSGYNQQDVTQKFVGKQLTGFIQKPYQFDDLKKVMKEVMKEGMNDG